MGFSIFHPCRLGTLDSSQTVSQPTNSPNKLRKRRGIQQTVKHHVNTTNCQQPHTRTLLLKTQHTRKAQTQAQAGKQARCVHKAHWPRVRCRCCFDVSQAHKHTETSHNTLNKQAEGTGCNCVDSIQQKCRPTTAPHTHHHVIAATDRQTDETAIACMPMPKPARGLTCTCTTNTCRLAHM